MAGEGKSQAKVAKETKQAMGSAPCRHRSTPGQAAWGRAAEKWTAPAKGKRGSTDHNVPGNKDWCNLSQGAQARHLKNDIRARVRSMIPGIAKISENGLMLQAAARIKQLEAKIDSVATHLERLQESQSSNGTVGDELESSLKDQNVPSASLLEPILFGHQAEDGNEKLRSVLPQPSKAKGTRLLKLAAQYMTELVEELDMKHKQVAVHGAHSSANQQLNQNTAEAADSGDQFSMNHQTAEDTMPKGAVQIQILHTASTSGVMVTRN